MVGSNKILTVSYGTFSCTLEGFDDSFHSMKAIAEYFRDLAQEDRYFGAEPPAPDAEMLARIAEKEISRRVEAQMDGSSVRLRAHAPAAAPQDASPAAVETPAARPAAATPEVTLSDDTVAVANDAEIEIAASDVTMPPVADAPAMDTSEASAFMASAEKAPALDVPPAPALHVAAPAQADDNSVAAKLQRIRAVVGKGALAAADMDDVEASTPMPFDDEDAADAADATFDTAVSETPAMEDHAADDSVTGDDVADVDTAEDDAAVPETADNDEPIVADVMADAPEDADMDIAVSQDSENTDTAEIEDDIVAADEDIVVAASDEDVVVDDAADAVVEDAADVVVEDDTAEVADEVDAAVSDDETLEDADTDTSEAAEEVDAIAAEAETDVEAVSSADDEVLAASDEDDAASVMVVDGAAAESSDVEADADIVDALAQAFDEPQDFAADPEAQELAWAVSALAAGDAGKTDTMDSADTDPFADVLEADASDMSSDLTDIDVPSSNLDDADAEETHVADADAAETDDTQKIRTHARIVRISKDGPVEVIAASEDDAESAMDRVKATLKTEAAADVTSDDTVDPLTLSGDYEDNADDADQPIMADIAAQEHDDIRSAIAAAMPAGSLSDEDEDDLQRELAEAAEDVVVLEDDIDEAPSEVIVEEIAAQADAPEVEAEAEAAQDLPELPEVVEAAAKPRKKLPEPDYAVTRMIAQTDEALNEPAGSRRRNAIAQLKAAVAATEAARQLGDKSDRENSSQLAFRDDLDQVVRPSRPIEAADAEQAQPDRPRASPLKLVASQRVDGDTAEHDTRAPAATKAVDAGETGGFAKFAAAMGATELPDLLEAAAAYTSFVEGVEDFSRPQIMKKVQMTTSEEFSREDGLRSFGTLLRQGRISKVRNGRFQVSEQTRFRPDARSA